MRCHSKGDNSDCRRTAVSIWLLLGLMLLQSACQNESGNEIQETASSSPIVLTEPQQSSRILWTGEITLHATNAVERDSSVDLDIPPGLLVKPEDGDLAFKVSHGTMFSYYLKPNLAGAVLSGPIDDRFKACMDKLAEFTPGGIPELVAGNVVCIQTDQGRLAGAMIKEINIQKADQAFMVLDIVVWDNRLP